MVITRDRINHSKRLPKIVVKDIIVFGIKASIVMAIYLLVQGIVLDFVYFPLDFPAFDLEDLMLNWSESIHMLYSHNPIDTLVFLIAGVCLAIFTDFKGRLGDIFFLKQFIQK